MGDNQALSCALENASQVIPVFILDPRLLNSPGVSEKRKAFLFLGLQAMDASLRQRGSYLVLRQGEPVEMLNHLVAETSAEAIFAEPDVSAYASRRDGKAARHLPMSWAGSPAARPPGAVLKPDGSPYMTFAAFRKAWKALPFSAPGAFSQAPDRISTPLGIETLLIPSIQELQGLEEFPSGEEQAQARLEQFVHGLPSFPDQPAPIYRYAEQRDRYGLPGTSRLSPYLRFGMLSGRQAVSSALASIRDAPDDDARLGADAWLNELIWREYYLHSLANFGVAQGGKSHGRAVKWVNNSEQFAAWCEGRTGFPVVDAAMRQLFQTGWMHNRLRMVVASFLIKDLLVDWRWGARLFMQHLIDGDPAANNGGWQWVAGTGMDSAPFFRILNPVTQSIRWDPSGMYLRQWLPELELVPVQFIHEPWKMPLDIQQTASCKIGTDYPAPVIDHAWARQRALLAYRQPDI